MSTVISKAFTEPGAPAVRFLPKNISGRDFVVGDIHGCTDAFWMAIERLCFRPDRDRIFSVGDLIDRGPDSIGALELLEHSWFYATRGNHEQMMLNAVHTGDQQARRIWMANGGEWATELPAQNIEAFCNIVERLPLALVVGSGNHRFNVIHAEFIGTDSELEAGAWPTLTRERLLWGRSLISDNSTFSNNQLSTTFCGHSVVSDVTLRDRHVFLDTGAYLAYQRGAKYTGRLTIVEVNLADPADIAIAKELTQVTTG